MLCAFIFLCTGIPLIYYGTTNFQTNTKFNYDLQPQIQSIIKFNNDADANATIMTNLIEIKAEENYNLSIFNFENIYGKTIEYYRVIEKPLFAASVPVSNEFIVDSIVSNNTTLIHCDTVDSLINTDNFMETQCVKYECIEAIDCTPCNYVCESSLCTIPQQQEMCVGEMLKYTCEMTYNIKTLYACPEFPSKAYGICNASCPDIHCIGYGSCACKNCTEMGYKLYDFSKIQDPVKSRYLGNFGYTVNDVYYYSSPIYEARCNKGVDPEQFCYQIYEVDAQGHWAVKWQNGATKDFLELGVYYNKSNPGQRILSVDEPVKPNKPDKILVEHKKVPELVGITGPICMIIFGIVFLVIFVLIIIFQCSEGCDNIAIAINNPIVATAISIPVAQNDLPKTFVYSH
ncbi:MAG: hypothetical protein Edafosvirus2_1 [Edafosvirus sp.]|uniref:Uncharacterized protein n=1 Tax=Edafosvirus sp. TaxID=2487765 RepID=A0A3G4ZSD2_9VIRU|nr:MAG: hypothetical protein Edafosvirus2_1 [Edafosvirus sp.]